MHLIADHMEKLIADSANFLKLFLSLSRQGMAENNKINNAKDQ